MADPDAETRRIAAESLAQDDPTGWFERLYAAADAGEAVVPWARGTPHQLLVEWAETWRPTGDGRRALVVGCGLGDDAEYIAGFGFDTVAFDIAETAVRACRSRFPDSRVHYRTAGAVAPGGALLVIAFASDDNDPPYDGPPWPLTRADLAAFASGGLELVRCEDLRDGGSHRWRAEFTRP